MIMLDCINWRVRVRLANADTLLNTYCFSLFELVSEG